MQFLKKLIKPAILATIVTFIILYPQSSLTVGQAIWTWIFVMTTAIALHEWGHFITMRIFGVKVVQFGIGMGGELFGFTDKKTGTRWSVCKWPLGGFVRPLSEKDTTTEITDANRHETMEAAKLWKRMIIILAGVTMNMITAYVVITGQGYLEGKKSIVNPTVAEVVQDSAASRAGLQVGDLFTDINGEEVKTLQDVVIALVMQGEDSASTVIVTGSNGEKRTLYMTVKLTKQGIPALGIRFERNIQHVKMNFPESVQHGISEVNRYTSMTFSFLGKLVTGQLGLKTMSGPVGIAKVTGDTYKASGMPGLFQLLAIISISLAIMNILPILPLDGGHFFMQIIEAIKGSPVPDSIQNAIATVGIVSLLGLMLFITFFDIGKIFG